MTSNRPYLIRAIYEWILDNGLTPHLLVDAESDQAVVPMQFVEDGKIVLNLSPSSIRGLDLGNDFVSFGARFSGAHFDVHLPVQAVLAVYARENGKGLAFSSEDEASPPPESPPPAGPKLRVVK